MTINAFNAARNSAMAQVNNGATRKVVEGEILTLREFFEKQGFDNVSTTAMTRNRDANGEVVMCPTVIFKNGVKLSISTTLVTEEDAGIQTLLDELGGEPSRENGVYRFEDTPENQYYYGHRKDIIDDAKTVAANVKAFAAFAPSKNKK